MRRRHGARRVPKPAIAIAAGALWIGAADVADASVTGKRGVEIEGPRDRRGFYIGPGLGIGATIFGDTFVPYGRIDFLLGGGVTKDVTIGLDLNFTPYISKSRGIAFGGDVEVVGFVYRGLFVRGGLGANGLPEGPDDNDLTVGLGGRFGIGYEFWLNQTAALGVGLDYDARFVPGRSVPRHGPMIGVRFIWY